MKVKWIRDGVTRLGNGVSTSSKTLSPRIRSVRTSRSLVDPVDGVVSAYTLQKLYVDLYLSEYEHLHRFFRSTSKESSTSAYSPFRLCRRSRDPGVA